MNFSVYASPPFTPDRTAAGLRQDFILRSLEGVRFCIDSTILLMVSPTFRTWAAPLPYDVDEDTGLPISRLPDTSLALRQFLLLCYPPAVAELPLQDLSLVHPVYTMAAKYKVPSVSRAVLSLLESRVHDSPYSVFAIASSIDAPKLVASAVRRTLDDIFVPKLATLGGSEFDLIDAASLLKLACFHQHCGKAAADVVRNQRHDHECSPDDYDTVFSAWWEPEGHSEHCGAQVCDDKHHGTLVAAAWFRRHILSVEEAVQMRPNCATAAKAVLTYTEALATAASCILCRQNLTELMNDLSNIVSRQVKRKIDEELLNAGY